MEAVALAVNDFKTVPLILVPVAAATAGFVCGAEKVFGRNPALSNIAVTAIVMGGMIPLPGLIAEAVVAERATKLRNVLTVMGCDLRAYWLGTLLGDLCLVLVIDACILALAFGGAHADADAMSEWESASLVFLLPLSLQMCAFVRAQLRVRLAAARDRLHAAALARAHLPPRHPHLDLQPQFGEKGADVFELVGRDDGLALLGVTPFSPHGAPFIGLANISVHFGDFVENYPPLPAVCAVMAAEAALPVPRTRSTRSTSSTCRRAAAAAERAALDEDVVAERAETLAMAPAEVSAGGYSLRVAGLRKLYPPRPRAPLLAAVRNLTFRAARGGSSGCSAPTARASRPRSVA